MLITAKKERLVSKSTQNTNKNYVFVFVVNFIDSWSGCLFLSKPSLLRKKLFFTLVLSVKWIWSSRLQLSFLQSLYVLPKEKILVFNVSANCCIRKVFELKYFLFLQMLMSYRQSIDCERSCWTDIKDKQDLSKITGLKLMSLFDYLSAESLTWISRQWPWQLRTSCVSDGSTNI